MPDDFRIPEPTPDHLADTGPSSAFRERELPGWRRAAGLLCLLIAAGLTVATTLLLFAPDFPPSPTVISGVNTPTSLPNTPETAAATVTPEVFIPPSNNQPLPTLSAEQMMQFLATPVNPAASAVDAGVAFVRDNFNPFTIIPDRPRSGVIQYTVQPGDTIFRIAERFGLTPESIAWANDRTIIGGLRIGRVINILPVDGVLYTVTIEESIASIAGKYRVDPYVIIDSEYNNLFGATPQTVLPSGTQVVVPGGTAEQISWAPRVERVEGSSTGVARISFAPGEPGSCGLVNNPGGGGGWVRPVSGYTFTRGFASWHTGVDLAASTGTPVMAANGGVVVFAGWNGYGYGNAVVLAHGVYTTLYGHMSAINVRCGQTVSAGQVIGAVGSTGQSSGPHLHFEIRYNDVPQDPTFTIPF